MTTSLANKGLNRREALTAIGGATMALAAVVTVGPAMASPKSAQKALAKLTGGRAVKKGRVKLKLPPIAENGNTVPMTISVDSPMTAGDYVKAIHVLADGNPTPDVASFFFTPASGKAQVTTRIRMAKTQNIIAVAEMSNGSLYQGSKNVKVTIGGCGG
jgi:sulfur-oxidizing protein SoxY